MGGSDELSGCDVKDALRTRQNVQERESPTGRYERYYQYLFQP
jgi:hypothetical protein